jgi:hypothetical protein
VRQDQSLAEMANEVLMRQAKVRADRRGEPIEEAIEAVLNTEAGKQLSELRDGPHGEESVEQAQVGVARERAQEREEDLGKRLGEAPSQPTVNGTNFSELRHGVVLRIHLPGTGVKIALAARFLWFRGGPPRAMAHFGEYAGKSCGP